MPLIDVRNVSKRFSRHSAPKLIREHLKARFGSEGAVHSFYALRDVSLTVNRNEGIQVFGVNGAGKSTLLNLVTGLVRPDAGAVEVTGVVGALLELGAGFHPDLTGRENLLLNAALIGISEKRAHELTTRIVEFAEMEEFTEEPLRTYSAGMIMRLAFSVAINLEPDVLIIDEVLGVGDAAFQQKCYEAIREIRGRGTSLLCVSHVTDLAGGLFERAIWLHGGEIVADGGHDEVAARYKAFVQSADHHRTAGDARTVHR